MCIPFFWRSGSPLYSSCREKKEATKEEKKKVLEVNATEKESGDTAQIAETLAKLEISTTHEEKVVDNFAANSSNLNSSSAKQETVEPKKVTIIEPKKNSGIEQ